MFPKALLFCASQIGTVRKYILICWNESCSYFEKVHVCCNFRFLFQRVEESFLSCRSGYYWPGKYNPIYYTSLKILYKSLYKKLNVLKVALKSN